MLLAHAAWFNLIRPDFILGICICQPKEEASTPLDLVDPTWSPDHTTRRTTTRPSWRLTTNLKNTDLMLLHGNWIICPKCKRGCSNVWHATATKSLELSTLKTCIYVEVLFFFCYSSEELADGLRDGSSNHKRHGNHGFPALPSLDPGQERSLHFYTAQGIHIGNTQRPVEE